MKYYFIAALLSFCPLTVCHAESCAEKAQAVARELDKAKLANNQGQIRGLEIALHNIRQNCRDSLLERQQEEKITKRQQDVEQAQQEVNKAINEGKSQSRVEKRMRKLREQIKELEEAQGN